MESHETGSEAKACPPVLVLAFNRPDTTQRVLESLRAARPGEVFFAVDGPRAQRDMERERVMEVRCLAGAIDWDCRIHTLFRDENLGCKVAVSQAISWFFSQVESGVVLEDDCIPHPSFFRFAAELLERYRHDERVMLVSGNNFQFGSRRTRHSYYYSRYNHIWGWASWRRAWQFYDHAMSVWPELRDGNWLRDILGDRRAAAYWQRIFEDTYSERNTSWAYRWTFACWVNNGLSVLPNVNLVSNIGFGGFATHTRVRASRVANLPISAMGFPLSHPPFMARDSEADRRTEKLMFSGGFKVRRLVKRIAQALGILR